MRISLPLIPISGNSSLILSTIVDDVIDPYNLPSRDKAIIVNVLSLTWSAVDLSCSLKLLTFASSLSLISANRFRFALFANKAYPLGIKKFLAYPSATSITSPKVPFLFKSLIKITSM